MPRLSGQLSASCPILEAKWFRRGQQPHLLQRAVASGHNDHVRVLHQLQQFLGLALIICLKYKDTFGNCIIPGPPVTG